MVKRLPKNGHDILVQLAQYKVMTTNQLSALNQRSRQVIRRNLRDLKVMEFVDTKQQSHGQGQGRPGEFIFLTETGFRFLIGEGIVSDRAVYFDLKTSENYQIDHILLINWVQIHAIHMTRAIPQLSTHFLSSNSYVLTNERPTLREKIQMGSDGEKTSMEFIPDGVFSLALHDAKENKTLLFFLEVDMGTESLVSDIRDSNDIRQKILNYQQLFRSGQYKRYESFFDSNLNGFRLLFVVNTSSRMAALCRLIQEMPPSDFIWITDQESMFSNGLSADIWARGGRNNGSRESILGPMFVCNTPLV